MKVREKNEMSPMDGALKTHSSRRKGRASRASMDSPSSSAEALDSAKVKFSQRAHDIKKIRAAVNSTPDVDEAKVAKYKNMIAKGQYKVDPKAVADKMVEEHAYNDFFNVED